ncbi:MAG: DNA adenine methylase [Planctomycetota bacterium]|nr:DNA adenine methylase [Planctomycetota bacterium]
MLPPMPPNRDTASPPRHHPRLHAAARTDDFLYAQLIPYIGNKRKLLPLIWRAIEHTGVDPRTGSFVDLFSGSGVVARLAKQRGFRTIAYDWEPYSHRLAHGTIALNHAPPFAALGGRDAAFARLNALPGVEGYITRHLCPADDERPDPATERMFFTRANGMRIDAVRGQVARWEATGELSRDESACVVAALIYAVSYVSNTSGVFKAYHRGWGGQTKTALYRILSPLTLRPPVLHDNGRENLALERDAMALAAELGDAMGDLMGGAKGGRPSIVYLDPPYNQHPYGSNYHVLNTVALGDEPAVAPAIRVAGRTVDKSAIRRDWRELRRSPFNAARLAPDAMGKLVEAIDADWLLVSYSTDGNIPAEAVLQMMAARGTLSVFTQRYKRYRVSRPRMSPRGHNVEFVAAVDLRAKPSPDGVAGWMREIQESA